MDNNNDDIIMSDGEDGIVIKSKKEEVERIASKYVNNLINDVCNNYENILLKRCNILQKKYDIVVNKNKEHKHDIIILKKTIKLLDNNSEYNMYIMYIFNIIMIFFSLLLRSLYLFYYI